MRRRRSSVYLGNDENEFQEEDDTQAVHEIDPDFLNLFGIIEEDLSLWNQVAKDGSITVYSKQDPTSPAILLKAYADLPNITPQQAFEAVHNG